MDRPELRLVLSQYLDRDQLAVCAKVSQDWNSTFGSLAYHTPDMALSEKDLVYDAQGSDP
jgi:hypothetical protein